MFVFLGPRAGGEFAFGGDSLRQAVAGRVAEIIGDINAVAPEMPDGTLALEAAVACGYLQMFAGESAVASFPARAALPAMKRLAGLLDRAIAEADSLESRWDAALPKVADELVAGIIEARMDAWAALETLSALDEQPYLTQAILACEEQLGAFDLALLNQIEFLSTLANTQLLANWRLALAPAYRDILPWWLDGTLEEECVRVEQSIGALERSIFQTEPAAVLSPHRLGNIRHQVEQITTSPGDILRGVSPPKALIRWRSDDGLFSARLLPHLADSGALLVRFEAKSGKSALQVLRGCVAVLGTHGAPIAWHKADSKEIVLAEFPVGAVQAALDDPESRIPAVVVMPDGGTWEPVGFGD